ncbi:hypothetical protein ACOMHN_026014 [Nucella lapillus]
MRMRGCEGSLLLLLLLLLLLHLQSFASSLDLLNLLGSVETEEGYDTFYVKENLTLECHKNSEFVGSVGFICVNDPESSVERINSTYARLHKPIASDHATLANYQCIDEEGLIGFKDIYVDYRPRKASNLQVTWLNKSELRIRWDFGGIQYKLAQVESAWRTHRHKVCTEQSRMTCNVSDISGLTDSNTTLHVRVSVTNKKRGDSAVQVFPGVRLLERAKPLPILTVWVQSVSSRSVALNVSTDHPELNYTITYYSTGTGPGHRDSREKVTGMTRSKGWEIADLHPHYTYHFDIRARFEEGFMSDRAPTIAMLQMPEDVPSSGPVLPPAAYYLDENRCLQGRRQSAATAYVYFQDIPPQDQNGVINSYTATVKGLSLTATTARLEPRTLKLDNVPCGTDFTVAVSGWTSVGHSPPAVLPVFAGNLSGHMEKLRLMNAIQYVEVNISDGQHVLKEATGVDMKFGAAVVTAGNVTSGIRFTSCVYNPTKRAGQPPEDLRLYQVRDHLEVHWKGKASCDPRRRGVILNYVLEVCQMPQHSACRNYTVEANTFMYAVKEVVIDREYRVRLWANTTSEPDALTDFSAARMEMESAPVPTEVIVVIAVMVVILVVFTMLVCCWVCRDKIRSTKYKFKSCIPELKDVRIGTGTRNPADGWNVSPHRKSGEEGVTNICYLHSNGSASDSGGEGEAAEAQTTGDQLHHDSSSLPPAQGDLRNASSDQSTADVKPTGDGVSMATDGACGTPPHGNTLATDSPAKMASSGAGMDMPLVVFSPPQETEANMDPTSIEEDVGNDVGTLNNAADPTPIEEDVDNDVGTLNNAVGPVSDLLVTSVGSRGYVKCSLAEASAGRPAETPGPCARKGGEHITVPAPENAGHTCRSAGESQGGETGSDPGVDDFPGCWDDDDDEEDDPSVSDDDQFGIGDILVANGCGLSAVEVREEADEEECGRHRPTLVESGTRMAVMVRVREDDEEGKEDEENGSAETASSEHCPQRDRLSPSHSKESLLDQPLQQGLQPDTEQETSEGKNFSPSGLQQDTEQETSEGKNPSSSVTPPNNLDILPVAEADGNESGEEKYDAKVLKNEEEDVKNPRLADTSSLVQMPEGSPQPGLLGSSSSDHPPQDFPQIPALTKDVGDTLTLVLQEFSDRGDSSEMHPSRSHTKQQQQQLADDPLLNASVSGITCPYTVAEYRGGSVGLCQRNGGDGVAKDLGQGEVAESTDENVSLFQRNGVDGVAKDLGQGELAESIGRTVTSLCQQKGDSSVKDQGQWQVRGSRSRLDSGYGSSPPHEGISPKWPLNDQHTALTNKGI